jgi:hypothetical protein
MSRMSGRLLAGLVMGLTSAVCLAFLAGMAAGGGEQGGRVATYAFLAGLVITGVLALTASSSRIAWARGCVIAGLAGFAVPLGGFFFSAAGRKTGDAGPPTGTGLGATMDGIMAGWVLGIFGFSLGVICIASAYVLYKRVRL